MRTIETTVYKYDELPTDEARERAREWYTQTCRDYEWWDSCYEDARTIGAALGFRIDDIFFSGFSRQGDGACFRGWYEYSPGWRKKLKSYCPKEATVVAIGDRLQAVQKPRRYRLQARITTGGRYTHEGTMQADVEVDDGRDVTGDEAREVLECARAFARWIYSQLESEDEYLRSEPAVSEAIRANEYEFLASGRPA